jgi:hypothetical protein
MSLSTRLNALDCRLPSLPAGCPICRDWQPVALCSDTQPPRPDRCPDCGRLVRIVTLVELVGVDVDRL